MVSPALAHSEGTTLPSLVQVEQVEHTAIYSANPGLPAAAYLALAHAAGVHSYTPLVTANTRVEAGGNMLVIHRAAASAAKVQASAGGCEVRLPATFANVTWASNGSLVCAECASFVDCGITQRTTVYLVSGRR